MKSQTQYELVSERPITKKKSITVDMWNNLKKQFVKTEIQITYQKNNRIIYSKDQVILRVGSCQETNKNLNQFTNFEQITNLQLKSQYGLKNKKIGKLVAVWNGEILIDVGGYFKDGLNQGLWNELFQYYWSEAQVNEQGEYFNNIKMGAWKCKYQNKTIGGGRYNEKGQQQGKWIELSSRFKEFGKVTYIGEYNNGQKIGRWDIWYEDKMTNINQQIGGGQYEDVDSIKNGRWVELNDEFQHDSQVILIGEYKKNLKVGRWDILYKQIHQGPFNQSADEDFQKIGGGLYKEEGSSIKIGKWIELRDGFQYDSQVAYNGEYRNGKKVGRWDTLYRGYQYNEFQQIGGGSYEGSGSQLKIGKWKELSDSFQYESQVVYNGEYKRGKKVGRWDILYRGYLYNEFKEIGGGQYDQVGSLKNGRWIELSDGFQQLSQVTITGDYQKGKKVGRWDIFFQGKLIGGGTYDQMGSIKSGLWTELSDNFCLNSKITYQGEYRNNKKFGIWNTYFSGKLIGGGRYDNVGSFKIGRWVELSDDFNWDSQITYNGYYKNGQKLGIWTQMKRCKEKMEDGFQKIKEMKYEI